MNPSLSSLANETEMKVLNELVFLARKWLAPSYCIHVLIDVQSCDLFSEVAVEVEVRAAYCSRGTVFVVGHAPSRRVHVA